MACYHPIRAYDVSGKYDLKRKIVFSVNPYEEEKLVADGRLLQLPCGQCIGCRLQYSRDWANRCMLELYYHKSAYFATLTYNDAHLPRSWSVDKETGEAFPAATLVPGDFQKFMKRLRFRFKDQQIRFFGAGEYGSESFRPHYHVILFGLELPDLQLLKQSRLGDQYFVSESFQSCWRDLDGQDIGYTLLGSVSWETCAYVARYIMKKQKGALSVFYEDLGIESEFSRMSLKPGIGFQYYQDHKDTMWKFEKINVSTKNGGLSFPPPRSYTRFLAADDPVLAEEISSIRKFKAITRQNQKMMLTDKDYYDILKTEEELKIKRAKQLRRIL